jgi:predicted acetyltransferase
MVRIIDVEKALKNIPANAEGEVNIKIEDPNCSWNSNVYKIEGNGKKLLIEKTDEDYHINADIQAITALLYGAYNLEEVKNRFKFESQDSKKEKILRLWFEKRFIFNTFYF